MESGFWVEPEKKQFGLNHNDRWVYLSLKIKP